MTVQITTAFALSSMRLMTRYMLVVAIVRLARLRSGGSVNQGGA